MRKTETENIAMICRILSVETRVRILHLLNGRYLCVGVLASRLDITQGAVSQHLRILKDARLVIAEKRGYYVHYCLNDKTMSKWAEQLSGFLHKSPGPQCIRKENRQCVMKRKSAKNRKT